MSYRYASTKFEVGTFYSLGEDTITRNVTDRRTYRLWYEINIPYLSNEKAGRIIQYQCDIDHNASADPEGGTGGPDPPWKITSYMGFYRE